jgi:nitrite reductase (NADH) small subunit
MSEWIAVGKLDDIPRRGARRIHTPQGVIAIFRTSDDRLFAVEDSCPHRQGPISQGIVHDTSVTCPLHGWVIDLELASARAPDKGCLRRFDVRLTGDEVCLSLPVENIRAAE